MRRRTFLLLSPALCRAARANAVSDAIGAMQGERSFAEQEAALLKHYAPDDVDGRHLYAVAKAAFDQLIDQLKTDLAQQEKPDVGGAFHDRLQTAIEARTDFTRHVQTVVTPLVPPHSKGAAVAGLASALARAVPELVKQFFDGGIAIWREWRAADKAKRDELAARLDAVRWRTFAEIAAE